MKLGDALAKREGKLIGKRHLTGRGHWKLLASNAKCRSWRMLTR